MQSELTQVRRAQQRGKTEIGWLHSRHSFSFGRYYDPHNIGYRALRVLNDDIVDPANGFGEHGHDNMEIITWVLEGALRHTDSTGTDGELRPGEAQVMTAGRGIRHSEMNPSNTQAVHFLQIWIEPNVRNLPPSYAQKMFAESDAGTVGNYWPAPMAAMVRCKSIRMRLSAWRKSAREAASICPWATSGTDIFTWLSARLKLAT